MNRDELFENYLRGELSSSETAELKTLLERDDEAGRALVGYVNETNLLVRVGSQIESVRAEKIVPLRPPSARPVFPWRRVALATCLMLFATLAFVLIRPQPSATSHPQLLASAAGVHLVRGDLVRPFQETFDLQTGDVIITGPTTAVIAYDGGKTRIEIQRDSVVQFADAAGGKHLELRHGALAARVAPQVSGHPMLLTTLHARATVIGTEFKLRAEPATTTLEVLEGKVQFTCRFDSKKVMVTGGFSPTADISGPGSVVPLLQPIPIPPQ